MVVKLKFSALRQDYWYDYAIRLVLGATVLAGLVADVYGPAIGGLMLGFPAIFCASATLTSRNERKKKEKKGLEGAVRGRQAAALDACRRGLGKRSDAVFCRVCVASRKLRPVDQSRHGIYRLDCGCRRALESSAQGENPVTPQAQTRRAHRRARITVNAEEA